MYRMSKLEGKITEIYPAFYTTQAMMQDSLKGKSQSLRHAVCWHVSH